MMETGSSRAPVALPACRPRWVHSADASPTLLSILTEKIYISHFPRYSERVSDGVDTHRIRSQICMCSGAAITLLIPQECSRPPGAAPLSLALSARLPGISPHANPSQHSRSIKHGDARRRNTRPPASQRAIVLRMQCT